MNLSFNPGSSVPEPDESLLTDPFFILIETQGRDVLAERYDYVATLLEEDFEDSYMRLFRSSRLHYEVVNLVSLCTKTMKDFGFPKRAANRSLRQAVRSLVFNYLLTHDH